jgi:hypothetical protein
MITLYPQYVQKVALTYRLLHTDDRPDPKVRLALHRAAVRCLTAHRTQQLVLHADVSLPLSTVVRMLEFIQAKTATPESQPSLWAQFRARWRQAFA